MIDEHEIPIGSRLYFGKSAKLKRGIEAVASELLENAEFEDDLTDALIDKLPSIVAQNMMQGAKAQAQARGGAPPEVQGGQGGNNAQLPSPPGGGKPPGMGINV